MKALISLTTAAALSLGAGCGSDSDPADAESASARINTLVPSIVNATVDSAGFVGESQSFADLANTFGVVGDMFVGADGGDAAVPVDNHQDSGLTGQDVADFLTENVFTPANYEGDGVFLVAGAALCENDFDPVECAAEVDAVEIRVHAELAAEGLDLTLLIGPERYSPIALELRSNSVAVVLNLGQAANALVHTLNVTGEEAIELPSVLEGVVALTLTVDGPMAITAASSIRSAINIRGTLPEDGGAYSFTSEAADPLFSVSVDGVTKSATIALALGNTTLSLPYNQVATSSNTEDFTIDLKGLSGTLAIAEGDTSLTLSNLGLGSGESTIRRGATKLLGVTLPAFTMTVDPVAETLAFDPSFDFTLDAKLQTLADEGEDIPSVFLNDTYGITISDTIQPVEETLDTDGTIKVVTGTMSLTAASDDSDVTVAAGQCLVLVDPPQGSHEILGNLAAGSCP